MIYHSIELVYQGVSSLQSLCWAGNAWCKIWIWRGINWETLRVAFFLALSQKTQQLKSSTFRITIWPAFPVFNSRLNLAYKLKDVLIENQQLDELYLHWNKITGSGGAAIAEGILTNQNLKVLDLSWNSLGNSEKCLRAFSKVFVKERLQIIHWDISFNKFTFNECQQIAITLEKNHGIYGIHFEGHYGYINKRGFLIIPPESFHEAVKEYPIPIKNVRRIRGVLPIRTENVFIQGQKT